MVISIIAILAAILLPAVGMVRRQARSTACQSNLRQLALIETVYTDENNGFISVEMTAPYAWSWLLLDATIGTVYPPIGQRMPPPFTCPVGTKFYVGDSSRSHSDYGISIYSQGKLAGKYRPSEVMVFAEAGPSSIRTVNGLDSASANGDTIVVRHGNRTNLAFIDGHVASSELLPLTKAYNNVPAVAPWQ